ncbi:lysozyme inhibitor LprI family protein [Trinickia fusca]|uniref:DUF1311 domain-containing protein n=1 Tax=Trinickia fusca TaxID=2419777 RepID=A0A494X3D6_9BURK|nr:lysozyme inhibitor LprI family protein [Trinickia fusca]RKP44860.1 DUF1311 domain-containing protein [Trinickia fusca]
MRRTRPRIHARLGRALLVLALAAAGAGAIAVPQAAHAEAAPADPIDTAMRECLARADRSSTAGQVQCTDAARAAWRSASDAAYQSLEANAPEKVRRGWQESQRRWLAWRNQEVVLVRAVIATTRGSVYEMAGANLLLQPERDRALALRRVAASFDAQGQQSSSQPAADSNDNPMPRLRACSLDAACEHAQFDVNRYRRKLRDKLPSHVRTTLARAQRAWLAYYEATAPLGSEADRADLIGARVATMKRLSETAGND